MQSWIDTLEAPQPGLSTARFFEDFGVGGEPIAPPAGIPPPPPVHTAAELLAARDAAFEAGFCAGTDAANQRARDNVERELAAIAGALGDAAAAARASLGAAAGDVARVLLAALRASFPALCARHGAGEVAAVARAVVAVLDEEPSIVVRSGAGATAALRHELDRLPPERAARVRCVVAEAMQPGDVRIEWCHGFAARDTAALLEDMMGVIESCGLGSGDAA